ncbi:MAG: hypothetical protein JWM91_130 [Rhodospirillales bacterium]|nr:hypothetical protein [Rhodospirillales bacterium]
MVAAERVAETVSPGAHGRRRVGLGESFWQFRPYQTGDTIERIDWRQSAKGDRLYIRETEWAAAQSVFLWRDSGPGMSYRSGNTVPAKRDRCELLLLALASLLLRGGERIALLGGERTPSSGRGALNAILAGLERETPLDAANRAVPRHATLVLFSDFLDPIDEIATSFERVAASGVAAQLVQVLDPTEMSLSFSGRVRFREMAADAPSESDALIPRVEAVRPAYLDALKRQQKALSELARARGWDFLVHCTDAPPEEPLRILHSRLEARFAVAVPEGDPA